MGMTDTQFKAFLREVLRGLRKIQRDHPDDETVKEMIESYQAAMED